jgi:hypothetical protein
LLCNFTTSGGLGDGVCMTTQGERLELLEGETCTFYNLNDSPWIDRPETLYQCAPEFLYCDVGQPFGTNSTPIEDAYGQTGTCRKRNMEEDAYPGLPLPTGVQCQTDPQCGFEAVCEIDDGGVNGTCVPFDGTCDSDDDCGWLASCYFPYYNDDAYKGYCRTGYLKKYESCASRTDMTCGPGLSCNDLGFCDTQDKACECDFEGDQCGRLSECSCPPAEITPKGTKPGCIDDAATRSIKYSRFLETKYGDAGRCLNESMIPKVENPLALKAFRDACGKFVKGNYVFNRFAGSFTSSLFGQPSCSSGDGPHPNSNFNYGVSYMSSSSRTLARTSLMMTAMPLLLLLAHLH